MYRKLTFLGETLSVEGGCRKVKGKRQASIRSVDVDDGGRQGEQSSRMWLDSVHRRQHRQP